MLKHPQHSEMMFTKLILSKSQTTVVYSCRECTRVLVSHARLFILHFANATDELALLTSINISVSTSVINIPKLFSPNTWAGSQPVPAFHYYTRTRPCPPDVVNYGRKYDVMRPK